MRLSVKSLKCKQSHETEDHVIMLAFSNKDKNLQPWIPVHEFPTIIIVVVEPLYLQYCKGLPLLTSISENNCSNEESGKKMETFLKHDVTSEWRHII